jgi:nucleoid-associated protein YejK
MYFIIEAQFMSDLIYFYFSKTKVNINKFYILIFAFLTRFQNLKYGIYLFYIVNYLNIALLDNCDSAVVNFVVELFPTER